MSDAFRPILYLKQTCPFCLKLRIFLTEAGLAENFEYVVFEDGDEMHEKLRTRMQEAGQEPSFPAVEFTSGLLETGTDELIERLSREHGIDRSGPSLLAYYDNGVFKKYIEMFRTLREQSSH